MTLQPEDPRITAYVLGELEADEAAALERAAAADPQLQEQINEAEEIQRFLKERLVTPTSELLPRQRENIRRSSRHAAHGVRGLSWTAIQPWLIPAAAAAVLTLATIILTRVPSDKPEAVTDSPTVAIENPAPLPKQVAPTPEFSHPGSLTAADFPTFELPVLPGKPELKAITQAIRENSTLPPRDSVRVEEILNSFQLRLSGTSAISRSDAKSWHPDNRDEGMSAHIATLSTEMVACPWKPSSILLLVSVRVSDHKDCDLKITFHANPDNVIRYRLLGFPEASQPISALPDSKLPAGSHTTLALEIEPYKPATELGTLEWSTDDKPAPSITLLPKSDASPSDDARFAALVCTYGQWLSGEQTGIIDREILSALSRETASANLPKEQADFLSLIDKSLQL